MIDDSWAGWLPLLLLGPAIAAWVVRRRCLLASLYLAQIAVYYGLSGLVTRSLGSPALVALVTLWAGGVVLGACVLRRHKTRLLPARGQAPHVAQVILAGLLITIHGVLVFNEKIGVAAQLAGGVSTPTGVMGTLATAAPIVALMLLVSALSTGQRVPAAVAVAGGEVILLTLSGFRGSAAVFVITAFTVAALRLPRSSPWRRPRRIATASLLLLAISVVSFASAANVKSRAAADSGLSSSGTQVFGLDQALPNVAARLDLRPGLQTAIDLRDDPYAADAVSWTFQLQALVPRALWPNKPVIDYGRRVSAEVYGQVNSASSSTVTTIGDTLINFGVAGVAIASLLLGVFLALIERLSRQGSGPISLALTASAAMFIVGQEGPLILGAAGLIRNLVIASTLWWLTARLRPATTPSARAEVAA
ncbi:hypothetical protein [Rugosimonospora africana]|nr:hypothetical protein [Rugosimonospora africana]